MSQKKTVHYYEFSSKEEEGEHADPEKLRKPKKAMKIQAKMMKMIRLLSPMKRHFQALEMTFLLVTQQPQAI